MGNGDCTIDIAEFTSYLKSEKFKSYLRLSGLDMTERDAKMIFMKTKKNLGIEGPVPTEDFLLECLKLKGDAKALDLWRCMFMQEEIHNNVVSRLQALELAAVNG